MTTCTDTYTADGRVVLCVREVDEAGLHRGSHQGWQQMPAGETTLFGEEMTRWDAWARLWTWTASSAQGTSRDRGCMECSGSHTRRGADLHTPADHVLVSCTQCGVLHDPLAYSLDARMLRAPAGSCFRCRLWWVRAERYAGRLSYDGRGKRGVRPHDDSPSFGGTGWLYTWCPGAHGGFGGRRFRVRWDDGAEVGPDDVLWGGGAIPWWWLAAFPPNGIISQHPHTQS